MFIIPNKNYVVLVLAEKDVMICEINKNEFHPAKHLNGKSGSRKIG